MHNDPLVQLAPTSLQNRVLEPSKLKALSDVFALCQDKSFMVSRPWILVLLALHGPMSQTALSRRIKITTAGMTTASDGLEKMGFVTVGDDRGDRRKSPRTITPRGRAFVAAMINAAFSHEKHTNHTHEPQDEHGQLPG